MSLQAMKKSNTLDKLLSAAEAEIRLSLPIPQKTGVPTPLPEYVVWG